MSVDVDAVRVDYEIVAGLGWAWVEKYLGSTAVELLKDHIPALLDEVESLLRAQGEWYDKLEAADNEVVALRKRLDKAKAAIKALCIEHDSIRLPTPENRGSRTPLAYDPFVKDLCEAIDEEFGYWREEEADATQCATCGKPIPVDWARKVSVRDGKEYHAGCPTPKPEVDLTIEEQEFLWEGERGKADAETEA